MLSSPRRPRLASCSCLRSFRCRRLFAHRKLKLRSLAAQTHEAEARYLHELRIREESVGVRHVSLLSSLLALVDLYAIWSESPAQKEVCDRTLACR